MTTQLPAHLANRSRPAMAKAGMAGLSMSRPAHISLYSNRFTWVDGAGNQRPHPMLYVDVVVVDVNPHVSRTFYDPKAPFDPNEGTPPICYSDNGQGASSRAMTPQHTVCQLCPWSAWNSATSKITGKGIPACAQGKKLAVVPPEGGNMVFQLRVPPASLKNWLNYLQMLETRGIEPYDCYTRVEFEGQGILKFSPAPLGENGTAFVNAQIAALTTQIWEQKAADEATGKNDVPWGGQADAQKMEYAQRQQLPPPPVAPAPQFQQAPQPPAFAPSMPPPPPGYGNASPVAPAAPFTSPPTPQAAPQAAPPKRTRGPNKPKVQEVPGLAADAVPPFIAQAPGSIPQQPMAAPSLDNGIPAFLQRTQEPEQAAPVPPPGPAFGMDPNPRPASDLGAQVQDALDAAFRLPT